MIIYQICLKSPIHLIFHIVIYYISSETTIVYYYLILMEGNHIFSKAWKFFNDLQFLFTNRRYEIDYIFVITISVARVNLSVQYNIWIRKEINTAFYTSSQVVIQFYACQERYIFSHICRNHLRLYVNPNYY